MPLLCPIRELRSRSLSRQLKEPIGIKLRLLTSEQASEKEKAHQPWLPACAPTLSRIPLLTLPAASACAIVFVGAPCVPGLASSSLLIYAPHYLRACFESQVDLAVR